MASITIPPLQYIGVNNDRASNDSMPLAFLTPGGTNSAAKKRISTVNSWCGVSSGANHHPKLEDCAQFEKDNPTAREIRDNSDYAANPHKVYIVPNELDKNYKIFDNVENVARTGFRITKSISRGGSWNGNNKVVRIEDPRGFELEISVDNLVKMMSMTTFIDGVCQEACVWGRQGASNILLPVTSELYKDAVDRTAYRAKTTISLRDVNFGDTVVLKKTENFRGLTGEYMGAYHVYSLMVLEKNKTARGNSYSYQRNKNHDMVKSHKRYIIKVGDKYFGVSGCKIHEITNKVDTPVERPDLSPDNFEDLSQGQIGTPICMTTNKVPVNEIALTARFIKSDDVDLLSTHDSGSATLWAMDSKKSADMMLFTRAYYSHHYSREEDQTEEERLKLFEGEITQINISDNTWYITGVKGEGGKGPFHILKNPLAKAALSIDDYEWYQIAFTVNDEEKVVPVRTLRRW